MNHDQQYRDECRSSGAALDRSNTHRNAGGYDMAITRQMAQMQPAGAASGLCEGTVHVPPHGAIESAMALLGSTIDSAFVAVNRLALRLDVVLQPDQASRGDSQGAYIAETQPPPQSAAVARLKDLEQQVQSLIARVDGLNGRLDT